MMSTTEILRNPIPRPFILNPQNKVTDVKVQPQRDAVYLSGDRVLRSRKTN